MDLWILGKGSVMTKSGWQSWQISFPRKGLVFPDFLVAKPKNHRLWKSAALLGLLVLLFGCTSPSEYLRNGFKVGPNYCRPAAPVAQHWIDTGNPNVLGEPPRDAAWWRTFRDPVLDSLVQTAYRQNLSLRAAGLRILEARAQRAIVAGELFPQSQQAFGDYTRTNLSKNAPSNNPNPNFSEWTVGTSLAWELDFWGRFRRAVESADARLDASVENYDDVLVLLLAEVAQQYVNLRTAEQRLQYAANNVVVQVASARLAEVKFNNGATTRLDVTQASASLAQTQSLIPPLEAAQRQATNQLCILLGIPPGNLFQILHNSQSAEALADMQRIADKQETVDIRELIQEIQALRKKQPRQIVPTAPAQVAVGIPAELLRRRPDIRRAERNVAAQSALIGVAVADLYPHFSIGGNLRLDAENIKDLFGAGSLAGNVGPSFNWNVLNYGRLANNVRLQEATFQQLAVEYQNIVLQANAEAENAIVGFLKAQQQLKSLRAATEWADQSLVLVEQQYYGGATDFNRVFSIQQTLTQQQDQLALAEGNVAANLIQLYKALGGGWQIRLSGSVPPPAPAPAEPVAAPPPEPAQNIPVPPAVP
jgi:outer membrane protein TolC